MKTKGIFKFFGIIAVVAIIGLSMSSCGPEDDGIEKTLTITGVTETGDVSVLLVYDIEQRKLEKNSGFGTSIVKNNTVGFELVKGDKPGERFTYSDSFYIFLVFGTGISAKTYCYTGIGTTPVKYFINEKDTTLGFDSFTSLD